MASIPIGPPVTGAEFIGRRDELRALQQTLRRGHALVLGPRRSGKTSLMMEYADQQGPECASLYLDVEGLSHPFDLLVGLVRKALENRTLSSVIPKDSSTIREKWSGNWTAGGTDLMYRLCAAGPQVLVILDELPVMLQRMGQTREGRVHARDLLAWLRSVRMDRRAARLRFIMAGSISMEAVARSLDSGAAINDLKRVYVGAMARNEALRLVERWNREGRIGLSRENLLRVLSHIAPPMPLFVNVFMTCLSAARRRLRRRLTAEDIEEIYTHDLLGTTSSTYFHHYYDRLDQYHPPELGAAARDLLAAVAVRKELDGREIRTISARHFLEKLDHQIAALLDRLVADYYLERDKKTGRYRFTSRLLADWWRAQVSPR